MSDDRKTPLWPWIMALLMWLPVLYVLSFGPACWIVSRTKPRYFVPLIYFPIGRLALDGPQSIGSAIYKYALVGMPSHSQVGIPASFSGAGSFLMKPDDDE